MLTLCKQGLRVRVPLAPPDSGRGSLAPKSGSRARLRSVGVELIYGEHVWPLAEPRTADPRELPWASILSPLSLASLRPRRRPLAVMTK
jgi:hypothetical protein